MQSKQQMNQSHLSQPRKQSLIASMNRNITNLYFSSAYIITNASMIVWSVVYHSWFGFVLLIWANLIWARKNQRTFMMKSTPALVVYSTGLLIFDYFYSMNFDESELPVLFGNVDLRELGLIRFEKFPGLYLMFKSFLMITFWITMQQMLQERIIKKHRGTLLFEANILKIIRSREGQEQKGRFSSVLLAVKEFCVFGLMWIIVLLLFVMSVIGQTTYFKIANMGFFLAFITVFQLSFNRWLRLMRFFWLALISYAMSALVLIYIYQFKSFPVLPLQDKIGLKIFETSELFRKLLPFTLVILLTGLQMNHFQAQFVKRVEKAIKNRGKLEAKENPVRIFVSKTQF